MDLQTKPTGRLIYLRRTDDSGAAFFLGRKFMIEPTWAYRLVRCEVDIAKNEIRCYRLRRRKPATQPLARVIEYHLPNREFEE